MRLLALPVSMLLLLAGCATSPLTRVEYIPLPDDEVVPTPAGATPRQRVVSIATAEWLRWGKQTARLYADGSVCIVASPLPPPEFALPRNGGDPSGNSALEFCPGFSDGSGAEATAEGCVLAQRYWRILGKEPDCGEITTGQWAWSAAFISWVMRKAQLDQHQFLTGESHSQYIVDVRDGILSSPAFELQPLPAVAEVGDLVCAVRGDAAQYVLQPDDVHFDTTPMHCDIVVAVDPIERTLQAIGGNVQQSVSMTTIDTAADGSIRHDASSRRPWLLILRNRLP